MLNFGDPGDYGNHHKNAKKKTLPIDPDPDLKMEIMQPLSGKETSAHFDEGAVCRKFGSPLRRLTAVA